MYERPRNRHKGINCVNFVFCFMWMKFTLAVFVFYLNTTAVCGKDHTNWEMFFSQFGDAWGLSWSQTWLLGVGGSRGSTDHWAAVGESLQRASCPTRDCCLSRWATEQHTHLQNKDPPCHAGLPFLYRVSWALEKKLNGESRYNKQNFKYFL